MPLCFLQNKVGPWWGHGERGGRGGGDANEGDFIELMKLGGQ